MKIEVTQWDIDNGVRRSHSRCPIALACNVVGVVVGASVIEIDGMLFKIPRTAQRFISNFDAGRPVKPFSFLARKETR